MVIGPVGHCMSGVCSPEHSGRPELLSLRLSGSQAQQSV